MLHIIFTIDIASMQQVCRIHDVSLQLQTKRKWPKGLMSHVFWHVTKYAVVIIITPHRNIFIGCASNGVCTPSLVSLSCLFFQHSGRICPKCIITKMLFCTNCSIFMALLCSRWGIFSLLCLDTDKTKALCLILRNYLLSSRKVTTNMNVKLNINVKNIIKRSTMWKQIVNLQVRCCYWSNAISHSLNVNGKC